MKQAQIDRVEMEVTQAESLLTSFELNLDAFHNQFRDAVPSRQWESLLAELEYIRQKLTTIRSEVGTLRHAETGR
jgi:hypothetical protein